MRQNLTGSGRYVRTSEIQSAVKGREAEVLEALGIDLGAARQHIRCPYPHHDDASPSWRFDTGKGRAYCTCIARGDSVFDVVAKMRGDDFDAAKLFVAEAIGGGDLICTRDSEARRYPASDAASLLDPPPDRRDDGLARAYLAHRLGTAAEAVPLPSTPVAGWTALPYFDPPTSNRRNAKAAMSAITRAPCSRWLVSMGASMRTASILRLAEPERRRLGRAVTAIRGR